MLDLLKISMVVLYYLYKYINNMDCPQTLQSIVTGRSSLKDWIQKNYNEFYEYLINTYNIDDFKAMVYMYYNGINQIPTCPVCGKNVKFHGNKYGFAQYCGSKCARESEESISKYKATNIERYGIDYTKVISKKVNDTKLKRYGKSGYNNPEKNKETCLEKYGVDNPMKNKNVQEKSKQTCLEKYGSEYYITSQVGLENKRNYVYKAQQTCLDKYGVISPMQINIIPIPYINNSIPQ